MRPCVLFFQDQQQPGGTTGYRMIMALLSMNYRARPASLGRFFSFFALFSALPGVAQNAPDPPSPPVRSSDLFARVISQQHKSEADLDEFERVQRVESRKPGNDPSATDTKLLLLFPNGTGLSRLPLTPDGKPSDSSAYRTELERLEKYLVWVLQDGPAQREAFAKADKRRKERFELIEATHEAFTFTLEGREMRGQRQLLRYCMTPRKDYKPTSRMTTLFTKVRGTIWIDEETSQLAKVEGQVTEDISLALFLAKVNKGSHFMQERYEVAPGVWAPTFEQYDFDGRKFLMPFSIHERTFYTSYKRVGPPRESLLLVRAELSKLPAENKP
jgi:hypothetical protein